MSGLDGAGCAGALLAALTRVAEGRFEPGVFSPESNDRDIAERAGWSDAQVVDELELGMTETGD